MNKPLLLSLVASATILGSNLSADTMYDRFEAMEAKMQKMQKELEELRAKKSISVTSKKSDDEDESEDADSDEETDNEEDSDEEEDFDVIEAFEELDESITEINKATSGNHLKFGVDYRFALENLDYEMANGDKYQNDAFMTNRFWLNMDWAATHQISFHGQLAYNKAFGHRSGSGANMTPFETFDWITNENAYDDTLRVKNAYFLYKNSTFVGTDIPWTFSIGRRPSTNGHLINLRDDDHAASPQGHSINVEFDGLSSLFKLENLTGVNGMYVKFCAGRGGTNAAPKFFAMDMNTSTIQTSVPYATTEGDLADIDLAGFIFRAYSDGQYTLDTQLYYANNLIGADINTATNQFYGMETVGGMYSATASFMINGIGDGISDFLDETTFFVSGAMSKTDPKADARMLYSEWTLDGQQTTAGESKTGYSYWIGTQFPSLITEDGRWGLEFNHGTKYWRSITYAEDTNIGSKMAARGNAYEAYFTEYLVEDILSMQIRYTYIDYDFTGSNGFFGDSTGAAMKISDIETAANAGNTTAQDMLGNIVKNAQDIRFYLRYKF
ncbi:DUF3373 family protein [Sulfurimonas marina]|uniref:DUF3373 domain-containing protein n=1 Tax=Sulfurimonas marina TaxID=2590551 RepID=A0A7M1AT00_9BACT|nr:DUF3373 family protein [Sulfurimonas marina]QOP40536.1 DUF3373 domain-containing protein [Sulfurimonas marina]